MHRFIIAVFFVFAYFSCNNKYDSIRFPEYLTTTSFGQNIDSLIKANKYTAIVLFCDNCGKGVSHLTYWDDIVKKKHKSIR